MPGYGEGCVSSCRHNIWGGDGTCVSVQVDPIEYECSCGDRYLSRDSVGSPSCVLKRALVGIYIAVALFGAVTVAFLLWTATKQWRLSTTAQATRRAKLRLRLIYSASAYSGSGSVIFFVAAACGTLYGSGMLLALYCTTMPLVPLAVFDMLEVWIDTLPSQLLPADSVAIKVMKLAEEKCVFIWVGRLCSGGLAAFGLLGFFFLEAATVVRCIDLMTGTAAGCAVRLRPFQEYWRVGVMVDLTLPLVCFLFVGFHLTAIINNAKRQARPSAVEFYDTAIHTLRIQVTALSTAAILWMGAVAGLEPWLGGVAARTPILPLSIMISDAYVGFGMAVHFAKVGPPRGALTSPGAASPIASRINAAKALISRVGSEIWRGGRCTGKSPTALTTAQPVSIPATSPASPGGMRVVPVEC